MDVQWEVNWSLVFCQQLISSLSSSVNNYQPFHYKCHYITTCTVEFQFNGYSCDVSIITCFLCLIIIIMYDVWPHFFSLHVFYKSCILKNTKYACKINCHKLNYTLCTLYGANFNIWNKLFIVFHCVFYQRKVLFI